MNNLRNLRKKKGLSLAQLHKITGYPLRTLEDWDAEKKLITSYHRIKRLSEILECSMDEFMIKEEKCVCDGYEAVIYMVQVEDGVNITVVDAENFKSILSAIVPREKALELLKSLKTNKDITRFVEKYL